MKESTTPIPAASRPKVKRAGFFYAVRCARCDEGARFDTRHTAETWALAHTHGAKAKG